MLRPARCRASRASSIDSGNIVPGTRIEQWFPLSSGGHYYEDFYFNVWAKIGAQAAVRRLLRLSVQVMSTTVPGLSWDLRAPSWRLPYPSHLTVFSPLGLVPLTTSKTADSATASAGGSDGYTITIHNPNTSAVSLTDVTDMLPPGFSYTSGSSTGATTADPSILWVRTSLGLDPSLRPAWVVGSPDISIFTSTSQFRRPPVTTSTTLVATRPGSRVAPSGDTAKITVSVNRIRSPLTKAVSGSGTVTSSPAGIDCGATCATSFANGTIVTLTATPDAGSTFTAWGGDCTGTGPCVVTMDQDEAVTRHLPRPPTHA